MPFSTHSCKSSGLNPMCSANRHVRWSGPSGTSAGVTVDHDLQPLLAISRIGWWVRS